MPSSVDEQPPSRPDPPRPQPARPKPSRGRATSRSRAEAPRRRAQPPARAPRGRPSARGRGRVRDEAESETGSRPAPQPRSPRKVVALLTVLSVAVVGLAVFAVSLSSRSDKKLPPAAPDNTPVPVTSFHDTQTGFTVEYPRSWKKVDVPVADYRLAVDGGNNVAFTIRVVPIEVPATAANLENFKTFTDGLVGSNNTVQVLKQQAVSLNGMLGYYYFYTFTDGGVGAVHAHYFLFSGKKMNVIVFQALPDDFARLAPTFDKIAESFRSDPDVPASGPPASSTTSTTR